MTVAQPGDEDQAQRWKGSAGCAWVEAQQMLDRTLQPFEDLLMAEVAASGARRVLVTCTLPEKELIRYGTRFGPVGVALQEADAQTRAKVAAVVRAAFDPYAHGPEVRFNASCWMMAATSP